MIYGESQLSFIDDEEIDEARALIDAQFVEMTGLPCEMRVAGFMIAVKIYIAPAVTEGGILLTDATVSESKYQSIAGLVVGVGPQAYRGNHLDGSPRYPEGPWCRVGDWVLLPRYEATTFTYRGVAMGLIPDDRIQCILTDPKDVQPFSNAARI